MVLFDEIEKAHPDVFNMMLQILEDGRLTGGCPPRLAAALGACPPVPLPACLLRRGCGLFAVGGLPGCCLPSCVCHVCSLPACQQGCSLHCIYFLRLPTLPLLSPCPHSHRHPHLFSPSTNRRADSKGRTVDFKNTLIILTSNVGSSVIEKGGGGIGFQLDNSEEDSSYNRIKSLVNEELKQYFR